ncbi:LOW QUALITY PROTEIN: tetratricopeptide repeat protein 22 [Morus bassanus]
MSPGLTWLPMSPGSTCSPVLAAPVPEGCRDDGSRCHVSCHRGIQLGRILLSQGSKEQKRLPAFKRTLALLQQVIKSSNAHYRTLAWYYLGMLLERKETFSTTPTGIQDCGFSETDPLDCSGKDETVKDNLPILNCLANNFHSLGKQEMAKGICNMALDVLWDPQLSWQVYCTQAQIHMKMYLQDLEHVKMGQGPVPDRRKLMYAKNHFERVLKACLCLRANLDMGQNCSCWMKLLEKAMEFDLSNTISKLQLFGVKCLWLKSQETLAIECFKQAIKVDDAGSTESLRCILEPLLVFFGQKLKTEMLMQEVEQGVKKAEEKFPRQCLQQELRVVCRNCTQDMIQLSKAMIARGKIALVQLLLETMKVDSSKGRMNEPSLFL